MNNFQILKDAFSYAFRNFFSYFSKWIKYLFIIALPLIIIIALFVRIALPLFVRRMVVAKYIELTSIEPFLYFIGILIALYLTMSFVSMLIKNIFDMHDGKEFRGFSDPLPSFSEFVVLFFKWFIPSVLMYHGAVSLVLKFANAVQKTSITASAHNVLLTLHGLLSFLLFILGMFIALRLALSYYIAIDKKCGVFEAFKESWVLTGKHLGLFASLYVIMFFMRLIPLGFLFTLPISSLVFVYMYRTISK